MKTIIGLSDQLPDYKRVGYKNFTQHVVKKHGWTTRPRWEEPHGDVVPSVSKGRWFVHCPDKTCKIDQGVDENQPLHWCWDCKNVANDFRPQRIHWNDNSNIQLLLGARKDVRQRNYEPHLGETLEHLEIENKLLVKGIYYGVRNG